MSTKTIFYGDHPSSRTANAYFNRTLINGLKPKTQVVTVTYNGVTPADLFMNVCEVPNINIGNVPERDLFGMKELTEVLGIGNFDIFLSNNDIWRLFFVSQLYRELHRKRGFKWVQVFPCDCDFIRKDWLSILKKVDYPLVYSNHGYNLYKEEIPKLQYIRPMVPSAFSKSDGISKEQIRKNLFGNSEYDFVIGVVAKNQLRKDLERTLEIFKGFYEKNRGAILYLHCEPRDMSWGYNLIGIMEKMGISHRVFFKKANSFYDTKSMVATYRAMDALLITSLGEGFCFPIVEAQLSEVPVVGAANTAITELINNGRGFPIKMTDEEAPFPLIEDGVTVNDSRKRCDVQDAINHLETIKRNDASLQMIVERAYLNALKFTEKSNFFDIFDTVLEDIKGRRKSGGKTNEKLLFVQYESAGDVLITTGLLEPLTKKYGAKIDYMVGPQFKDIIIDNPTINCIRDWDMDITKSYKKILYPHQLILPGNWGSNDATLYEVYARLCDVEYGKMFIEPKKPENDMVDILDPYSYITVSNCGGHKLYRYYPYFPMIFEKLKGIIFVQIGGAEDPKIPNAFDLTGKLSFRESAYVVKNALFHVGVDSFPSHLAACLDVPQVTLYGCGIKRVIRPRGWTIDIDPNYIDVCPILGPCWGNYRNCQGNCIKSLDKTLICNSIAILYDELSKDRNVDTLTTRVGEKFKKEGLI